MLKRVSVLVMVIVLILGMAACAKTEGDVQGTETTTSVQQTTTTTKAITTTVQTKKEETTTAVKVDENPFAEKMEITWLVGTYSSHLYEEGRWDELELEEKFNVDLKMWNIMVDSSNMEQVQMMLAAGDVPDYGFYYTSGQYLYEQGLGRTIPLNMMKEYYQSYYKNSWKTLSDCNSTRYRIRKESITVLPLYLLNYTYLSYTHVETGLAGEYRI